MNRTSVLLAQLQAAGISLSADGDKLNIKSTVSPIAEHWLNELKTNKQALLALLNQQSKSKAVLSKLPPNTAVPATSPQLGLWMLASEGLKQSNSNSNTDSQSNNHSNIAYNVAVGFRLEGALDKTRFSQSVDTVLAHHDAFALRFVEQQGTLMQSLTENWQAPMASGTLAHSDINATLDSYARTPFSVVASQTDSSPLYRHGLYQLADNSHVYLFACHHMIIDGHSLGILFEQISQCYNTLTEGNHWTLTKSLGFMDYAHTLQQPQAQQQLCTDLHYWQQQLEGAQYHFEFPPCPKDGKDRVDGAIRQPISDSLYQQALATAKQLQVSPFSIFYSAYKLLLGKISTQQDFLVGHPIQNRAYSNFEQTLGYFANTIALRTPIEPTLGFDHHVNQVHQANIASLNHQSAPFEQVVARLNPERVSGLTPLYQCFFALQQDPPAPVFTGIDSNRLQRLPQQAKFALSLTVQITEQKAEQTAELVWEYSGSRFTQQQIIRLHQRFEVLLQHALSHPKQPVNRIDYWAKDDHALFKRFNSAAADIDTQTPILSKIEAVMVNQAQAIAVVQPDGTNWTYRQLDAYARQIAELYQQHGLKQGDTVVLSLNRSTALLAAQLAALRMQITFAPMSPKMPQERLSTVLTNSKASLCLCLPEQMTWQLPCPQALAPAPITIDQNMPLPAPISCLPTDVRSPAYIVHTSGSTGIPKGIEVSHFALNNMATGLSKQELILPGESSLMVAGESFDLVIMDSWLALLNGAKIYITDEQIKSDIEKLCHYIAEHKITCGWIPTAYIEYIVTDKRLSACFDHARLINTGGAKLTLPPTTQFKPILLDLYGPSENTVASTTKRHHPAVTPTVADESIGNPVANCTIEIVAPDGSLCAPGIIGEIMLKGDSLANGYIHRPDLTEKSFIGEGPNRYYRSGDLGWINERAELVYIGRNDNQVQIRGFRVELGEIENLLSQQPQIGQACVLYAQQTSQLRAYVTPELDDAIEQQILSVLEQQLPFYMVPSRIESMTAFPLTPNDKIDSAALLRLPIKSTQSNYSKTSANQRMSSKQLLIARIFADLLQQPLERIGLEQNFYQLGGHSLLAMKLLARLKQELNVVLTLGDISQNPTVQLLAELQTQRQQNANGHSNLAEWQRVSEQQKTMGLPVSPQQESLLSIYKTSTISHIYNVQTVYRINETDSNNPDIEGFTVERLTAALRHAYLRHHSLHSQFIEHNNQTLMRVAADPSWQVDRQTITPEQLEHWLEKEQNRQFDLENGPVFIARLFDIGSKQWVLQLNMPHLVTDGWSMMQLWQEIVDDYANNSTNAQNSIGFIDYLGQQRDSDNNQQYWLDTLSDYPPVQLHSIEPEQLNNQQSASQESAIHKSRLHSQHSRQLQQLAKAGQVSEFVVATSLYALLMGHYLGRDDLVISTPYANREDVRHTSIHGYMVSMLPIRLKGLATKTFGDALAGVDESLHQAKAVAEFDMNKLMADLHLYHSAQPVGTQHQPAKQYNPLQNLVIMWQGGINTVPSLPHTQVSSIDINTASAKFPLSLSLSPNGDSHDIHWSFDPAIISLSSVKQLTQQFEALIEQTIQTTQQSTAPLSPKPLSLQDTSVICQSAPSSVLQSLATNGKTIDAEQIRIVNHANQPVPLGFVGTLVIDGQKQQADTPHQQGYIDTQGHLHVIDQQARAQQLQQRLQQQKQRQQAQQAQQQSQAPKAVAQNAIEQSIVDMFQGLLDLPNVGIEDNFFHIGGHSLLAIRLSANIDDEYQIKLNFQQVFENNTPKMLAALIDQMQNQKTPDSQASGLLII